MYYFNISIILFEHYQNLLSTKILSHNACMEQDKNELNTQIGAA